MTETMKKFWMFVTLLCLLPGMASCDASFTQALQTKEKSMGIFTKAPLAGDKDIPEGNHILIETDHGNINVELYPDVAPNTVANFKALAGKGFYDGLKFHRVIAGFMAQGGDPEGTGMGGPGYKVKAEFSKRKHVRGTVAMARSSSPDSAGSQFYICYGPQPHLDGQYTIFGQVTEGMEAVDKIKQGDKMLTVRVMP
ncbi:MAG: peptidyl-prolyl cis-trans isomerase [Zetaproteobacteria bacterium CG_4_9_14_3_um_filter_49_83]|nr:MAG: peptidyl-prolyl cis-trans isomerase [Zetaproteobacteria bacterium CG17_big_fil_post_rev_8_21_14_2_50_50_13]PIV31292.1 MAG: peptidyl-prolyl cis-trans isomerase [Zetaproteobacteria bacterium CG02_land_8_20_14_3_00_50_9]PIY55196.1 MAG: peptidyl-prolyl cis-trans isomerase [Zetaproteobacteria bacterium CG_4_10_14_0_8_um_filter_49_80]PJA35565.1 MAG: peptidyl-prolyl cis-trans isomerase [Zetaproteobacteria bacterium CG_4_9_14_3_um_filter_49_83]